VADLTSRGKLVPDRVTSFECTVGVGSGKMLSQLLITRKELYNSKMLGFQLLNLPLARPVRQEPGRTAQCNISISVVLKRMLFGGRPKGGHRHRHMRGYGLLGFFNVT